jgi:hypothetical protein
MLNKFFALVIVLVVTTAPIWASESNDAPRSKHRRQNVVKAEDLGSRQWSSPKSWETQVMGVKVKGTAQRLENDIRGVLHIYPPLSDKWTFHWTGKIEGDMVYASHTDGHVFRGSITPEKTVDGILTTRDGHQIPLRTPLP